MTDESTPDSRDEESDESASGLLDDVPVPAELEPLPPDNLADEDEEPADAEADEDAEEGA